MHAYHFTKKTHYAFAITSKLTSRQPDRTCGNYQRTMESYKHNKVWLGEDINIVKGKVNQMLEALSKNNLQHAVMENVDPALGFTVVTNQMYGLPPDHAPP